MRPHHAFLAALALAAGIASADPILPGGTAAATRQAIQAAIDAAAPAQGTVTLGAGTFEINAQLMVTGGVTVVGQGWEKTVIKQVATPSSDARCAWIKDGSKLVGVTLTGGRTTDNWNHGAGALIDDGTVSWCCISNNQCGGRNIYGGGVSIAKGTVDHSIVVKNLAGTYTSSGGGIGAYNQYNTILIDACLIAGNEASITDGGEQGNGGGGIGFFGGAPAVTIRNTTITGNSVAMKGGGLLVSGSKTTLLDSIVSGNAAATDADVSCTLASGSSNNLVGGDPQVLFADATGGDFHLDPESPAIRAGTAYEGIGSDLDGVAFASPPSIGCYEYDGELLVVRPVFSPASGVVFSPSLDVALSCRTDGAAIFYTTDGSDPTDESTPYAEPIHLTTGTTTIRARAYKAGMMPSRIVEATYTYGTPTPPVLGEVTVAPMVTMANIHGAIVSIGNNAATGCDVYLAIGTRPGRLGDPARVVSGAIESFDCVVPDLVSETTYYYEITIVNDAQIEQRASARGQFTTLPGVQPIAGDPAATRSLIQAEIDAAARMSPAGTVALGSGLFEIDEQLMVTNGVTLVGQGWEKTTIQQVAATPSATTRCVEIDGGSKLENVTLTGARVAGNNNWHGGAALVKNGTISWCCITNNTIDTKNSKYGAGVAFFHGQGQIDHSIIAHNSVSSDSGTCGGGGVSVFEPYGSVTIDTCLIYGNTQSKGQGGAGLYADFRNYNYLLKVCNTTIADNEASGEGGGVYVTQYNSGKVNFMMLNTILADNASGFEGADPNLYLPSSYAERYAAQSFGNLFANGTPALGEGSKSVAGSGETWFVKASKGNYHLPSGSVAVGVGKWYAGIAEDLDRSRRLKKPAAGCYEAQFCTILIIR